MPTNLLTFASQPSYAAGYASSMAESGSPGLWQGLRLLWVSSLGVTGGRLRDVSGNGHDGTLSSLAVWSKSPRGPEVDLGVNGATILFDGDFSVLSPNMTYAIGVTPTDTVVNDYISDFEDTDEFALLKGFQNGFYNVFGGAYPTGAPGDSQIPMSGAGIRDWVVWTKEGSSLKGYVNGILYADVVITTGNFTPTGGLIVGERFGGTSEFTGSVDSVALWSRALTATQIAFLFAHPFAPITPPDNVAILAALLGAPAAGIEAFKYYYDQQEAVA